MPQVYHCTLNSHCIRTYSNNKKMYIQNRHRVSNPRPPDNFGLWSRALNHSPSAVILVIDNKYINYKIQLNEIEMFRLTQHNSEITYFSKSCISFSMSLFTSYIHSTHNLNIVQHFLTCHLIINLTCIIFYF